MATAPTAQQLADIAAAAQPLHPEGRALAFLVVTIVLLVLSIFFVSVRLWFRLWKLRASKVWGWEDLLALLGLITYVICSAYGILLSYYGLGTPDRRLTPGHLMRAAEYYDFWEIFYLISVCLVKTSIGLAVVRISITRRYSIPIWAFVIINNLTFLGALIWLLQSCRPFAARWNSALGTCNSDGILAVLYTSVAVSCITDAGCAIVPVFIVRKLQMPSQVKYALMAVLATGGLAAVFSVARFGILHYLAATEEYLYNCVWMAMLSTIEVAIGLIAGSLPSFGRIFHIWKPSPSLHDQRSPNGGQPARGGAKYTFGGTPMSSPFNSKQGTGRLVLTPQEKGESRSLVSTDQNTCHKPWSRSLGDEEEGRLGIIQERYVSVSSSSQDKSVEEEQVTK